jgi:hypothetical protein
VGEAAGMSRPHILFWGHEPRPTTGWTDAERVSSYVCNNATSQGLGWRVPDAPFVMETFCMGDHDIVSGYRANATGQVEPVLLSPRNDAAEAWGLRLYRSTLYAFRAGADTATRLRISWLEHPSTGMGFNRVTWTPGHDRKPIGASRSPGLARLRRQRETRARESTAGPRAPEVGGVPRRSAWQRGEGSGWP